MSFNSFLAYSASAGSGKTFALAARYVSLLFMGESPASILAATFTNKAAAEMRQRVVDSLRGLGNSGNEAFVEAIASQTGWSRGELLEKQPEVLARFLASRSSIVTLDSFFSSTLRSASLELGLEPDFVTKEQSHEKLEVHFLEEVRREHALGTLVRLAMDIEDKRFGKIFDLMQNFYKVDPLLPERREGAHDLTVVEEQIERLRVQMIDALQAAGAAARCIKQFDVDTTKALFAKGLFEKACLGEHSWFKKSINDEIEALFVQLKEALLLWAKHKEAIVLDHLFAIYDYYRNATIMNARESGVLSFDDLSYFTYRLLHESISRDFLYFKIDSKFNHILLDEFQDTSTLQFLLLKPLIDEVFSGQGQSEFKTFFYVGDTKQSLYRFRGGVEELFDKVSEHYGVVIEEMAVNYRSSRLVVEQVNRWFETTMPGYVAQESRADAAEGYVNVVETEAPIEEALKQAQRLREKGVAIERVAFLVSTNKDGMALQEACETEGIPTLLQTTSSLRYHPKVAALVVMLRYLFEGEGIDAEPLLERVGLSLDRMPNLDWFSPFMEPLAVLDRLLRDFGYFDEDTTILKLLEFAANFSDIPTFMDEFENSSIAVAAQALSGAKIMTIHGSKGLEFDHVIVLDKLTRKNSNKSPLIYHYNDALAIDRILYRMAKRENFDRAYREIVEARRVSEEKDHKNVLYVALTRAAYGLTVIKKEKDSIFDPIGMVPVVPGAIDVPEEHEQKQVAVRQRGESITLTHYGTQEISKRLDEEEMKDWDAILFGTALHYLLEMMGSFDTKSLDEAMIALTNRYGQLLEEAQIEEIRRRALALISDQRFRQLLKGAVISKEQAISFEGESRQIDLLLEYAESCLVVDYKSSGKYQEKHRVQVSYYQKAIEKITGKRTDGMVLYLLEDEIELLSLK